MAKRIDKRINDLERAINPPGETEIVMVWDYGEDEDIVEVGGVKMTHAEFDKWIEQKEKVSKVISLVWVEYAEMPGLDRDQTDESK